MSDELDRATAESRNLVVCCDGTGNKFGVRSTNVVHLCRTLVRDERQLVFYDPGVGTMSGAGAWSSIRRTVMKAIDGAIARSLDHNVVEAYDFLANNYQRGDRIYLFGYSRGAYTVRALAAMLHMYGLAAPNSGNLTPYVVRLFRGRDTRPKAARFRIAWSFRKTFAQRVPVHFVGVWDTVSSVGWLWDPQSLPYTRTNPNVAHGRHAVAIDERRAFFRTNLWSLDPDRDLQQVWFAGVHADVGGGRDEEHSGLSKIALEWMLDEAEVCGLRIDPKRRRDVLGGKRGYAAPNHAGPIRDSLRGFWRILEFMPKLSWSPATRRRALRMNLGRRRIVPEGAVLHPSVRQRIDDPACAYDPPNLR